MPRSSKKGKVKVPPHNTDAERSLLGAILIDQDTLITVAEVLSDDRYFYSPAHRHIYSAMLNLYYGGSPVDVVTVANQLKKVQKLTSSGGRSYIVELVNSTPTSAHAEEYANIIKDLGVRRALISLAARIEELGFSEDKDVTTLLDEVEKKVYDISQEGVRDFFVHIKKLLKEAYERAEQVDSTKEITGTPSGFVDLDAKLGGLQKSDLIIVAARPSVGKTSFMLDLARYAAIMENRKLAIFSLEMSEMQIVDRMIAMEGGFSFWGMRTGHLSDDDFSKMADSMGRLSESELFIDDKPGQSIMELRTKARRLALEQGIDMIMVDYLQLIHGFSRDNRVQEITEVSMGLKNIARELNVPVIAAAQLSRAVESRTDKIPQLSDLRDSGSIEQDADVVMFLHREEIYDPETERKGIADVIIGKHRNGPTGRIELAWLKELGSFRNLAKESQTG